MDASSWLSSVRYELTGLGVSACYRERILEELRDHVEDISFEQGSCEMSTEALHGEILEKRLGKPEEIASAAHRNLSQRSFAQRHPIITFLVVPIPVLVLLWVGYAAALVGLLNVFSSHASAAWAETTASIVIHSLAYIPVVILTLALARVANRTQVGLSWWLAGSILIAIVAGMMMVGFRMPTAPGNGQFQVGLSFPLQLAQWPQVAVPLAITFFFWIHLLRTRNLQRDEISTQ